MYDSRVSTDSYRRNNGNNVEGMMDLENNNNVATTIRIIALGNNHYVAKNNG